MTDRIFRNRLLVALVVAFSTYWLTAVSLDGSFISTTASFALFLTGVLTLVRYSPAAYYVLWKGGRSDIPGAEGSHLAVLGTTLLSLGCIYSGFYGLLWISYGQPTSWLGTGISSFGRFLMAVGFSLMYYSPAAARPPSKRVNVFWMFTGGVVLSILFFVLGTRAALWHLNL